MDGHLLHDGGRHELVGVWSFFSFLCTYIDILWLYFYLYSVQNPWLFVILDNMPIPIGPRHDSRDIIPDAHHEFIIHGFNLNLPAGNKELIILYRYIN